MPELLHVFSAGRMNKDFDDRLVPNGEYRDALNLEITDSDGSNVGTLQNLRGNIESINKYYNPSTGVFTPWSTGYINSLANPTCVGRIVDATTERIYWFIESAGVSAIAEYDQIKDLVIPILVDTQNILKFSKDYLITGINIIEGVLFFTDNQTEPKSLNINTFRALNTPDFLTHTQIYGRPFQEQDITVIRKKPLTALALNMSSSARGGAGTGIDPSFTTYIGGTFNGATSLNFTWRPDAAELNVYAPIPTRSEWTSNPTAYPAGLDGLVTLVITPQPNYLVQDNIILTSTITSATGDTKDYSVRLKVVGPLDPNGVLIPTSNLICEVQSVPKDLPRGTTAYVWKVLLEEKSPLYNLIFPRFSYRWKYNNNNLSAFAPFTEVAFLGDKFKYLSSDGYNTGMVNNLRKLILQNITWGNDDVSEVEIIFKRSDSANVYSVAKLKRTDGLVTSYTISNEIVGAMLESNQLLRPYDNVPLKARAQEIVGNRLIYGNYTQQYDLTPPNITASISVNTRDTTTSPIGQPLNSLKSMRTYQLGLAYLDNYGRETPVFSSNSSAAIVLIDNAQASTSLQASVQTTASIPSWATHYKYFVKEVTNEYYNLALDRFYYAEDGNVWLSFPSSERNKVEVDTYLVLKKKHNSDEPVTQVNKYKILAISSEAPTFIATTSIASATATCTLGQNPPGVDVISFLVSGPTVGNNSAFHDGVNASKFLTISYGSDTTNEYGIASGGPNASNPPVYTFKLQQPLGQDAAFLDALPGGTGVTINLIEKKVEIKPEFEGRFFAKINLDSTFQTNVIDPMGGSVRYGSVGEKTNIDGVISNSAPGCGGDGRQNWAWYDPQKTGWRPDGSENNIPSAFRYTKAPTPTGTYNRWFGFAVAGIWGGYAPGQELPLSMVPGNLIRFIGRNGQTGTVVYRIEQVGKFGVQERRKPTWTERNVCGYQDSGRSRWFQFKLNKPFVAEPAFGNYTSSDYGPQSEIIVGFQIVEVLTASNNKVLSSTNPAIFETEPKPSVDLKLFYQASDAYPIAEITNVKTLPWHNCYSYGNGVESNRLRDDYNAVTIDKGPVVSSTLDIPYQQEIKTNGLIFSGIFNSVSGVNNLNQFIQAESITKNLNPYYGSIQALLARDTDLLTFCEDKVLNILANKDALYNADGNSQLTATNNVLGQATPYVGEFGISKNPESLASYGFRTYFTDKARGTVLRLSRDGLEPIGDKGMTSFFFDNLPINKNLIGSFDDSKATYTLTLNDLTPAWQKLLAKGEFDRTNPDCEEWSPAYEDLTLKTTVLFKENASGWTSRASFIPENGASLNSMFYTFKNGRIWKHNDSAVPYNNFYGVQYDSSVNVLINDDFATVKGFKTLNYTGSDSREYVYTIAGSTRKYSIAEIQANNLIPTSFTTNKGWYANYIVTDLQEGKIKEFIKKEGKHFNYIKGLSTFFNTNCDNNVSSSEFAVQGIGNASTITGDVFKTEFNVNVFAEADCFQYIAPPVLVPQSFIGVEDQVGVYSIGQDNICSSGIIIQLVNDNTTNGTLSAIATNGSFTFTPNPNYNGPAGSFTVVACCNGLCGEPAVMTLDILTGNIIPITP